MSTILDIPEVQSRVVKWSVSEYEALSEQGLIPRNAELIRGLVIEKMPKSPLHRKLSKRLYDLIQLALPTGFVVFQEAPLQFADSEPEPDISVVNGSESDFDETHPMTASLVVEVAVSSAALDRANAAIYAEAGISEYWIVLAREQRMEIYKLAASGRYDTCETLSVAETATSAAVPGVSLALSDLFTRK